MHDMRNVTIWIFLALGFAIHHDARGAFTLSLDSGDFGAASVYNKVALFSFQFAVAEPLVAGREYSNPTLQGVAYTIRGVLDDPIPTPSMFPGFFLVRTIDGADFYNLSPDATLRFTVADSADFSDGLQFDELDGTGTLFEFNARELDQAPGRYHPPILTLDSDGTGRLTNADNQSTFPNPPPPTGSGLLVDVEIAEEYDVRLSFNTGLTIVAVPEPSAVTLVAACFGGRVLNSTPQCRSVPVWMLNQSQ